MKVPSAAMHQRQWLQMAAARREELARRPWWTGENRKLIRYPEKRGGK